jgi:hypothetical protein
VSGKVFFFEKKKQKTFTRLAMAFPERLGPGFKSFLVLFFKKELLSFPYTRVPTMRRDACAMS